MNLYRKGHGARISTVPGVIGGAAASDTPSAPSRHHRRGSKTRGSLFLHPQNLHDLNAGAARAMDSARARASRTASASASPPPRRDPSGSNRNPEPEGAPARPRPEHISYFATSSTRTSMT